MALATRDISKKARPSQRGTPVLVRLQPDQLAALDGWREEQGDAPSRPEAVRRLIERAIV